MGTPQKENKKEGTPPGDVGENTLRDCTGNCSSTESQILKLSSKILRNFEKSLFSRKNCINTSKLKGANDMSVAEEIRKMIEGKSGINITLAHGLLDRLDAIEKNIKIVENAEHFKCHPLHPEIKKLTIEGKLYKEYSASYRDTVIKLYKMLCDEGEDNKASGLRETFNVLMARMNGQ